MIRPTTIAEIEYPETDGQPMGETDLHRLWMIRIYDLLSYRLRGQQAYIASDLLVYYTEGEPSDFVVPDVFVVKDCQPGLRRVFKTWEEGRVPNVVVEVTSRKTRGIDESFKPQTYARIGVLELFLYDPTGDYLTPALQGFNLQAEHRRMLPDGGGALYSQELGLTWQLEKGLRLSICDSQTGQELLTPAEAAEARARAAEEEISRLRQQLDRERRQP